MAFFSLGSRFFLDSSVDISGMVVSGGVGVSGHEEEESVTTLGALNAKSFSERVLSCVKLVVSDIHVRLKPEEIRMLVMNHEFMEYMRSGRSGVGL